MSEFLCMNLRKYFNHKLIAEEIYRDKIKSKFNSFGLLDDGYEDGVFYNPDSLPNSFERIKLNDILFVFPDKSIDEYDNISCEGEVIFTPNLSCTSICFLGLSDSINMKDQVKLTFLDGSSEKIDIFFYKWHKGNKFYINETTDEKCEIALKSIKDKATTGYIYSYKATVSACEKNLSSIELPFNPCLHILSITLKWIK